MKNLLPLFLLLSAPLAAAPFTAFRDGETFSYKVNFALFPHAGDIIISARPDPLAPGVMAVTTQTRSNGLVRSLYAFDNLAEVRIDRATSRLLSERASGADPKRATSVTTGLGGVVTVTVISELSLPPLPLVIT